MSGYNEVSLLSSASRTSSGNGSSVDSLAIDEYQPNMRFALNVTAQSGTTPTLDVDIEGLIGNIWYVLGSFTQVGAATGKETITVANVPEMIRASYTLGGTSPDYTFQVDGVR